MQRRGRITVCFPLVFLLLACDCEKTLIQRVILAAAGAAFLIRLPDGFHQFFPAVRTVEILL